ncbi:MAG: sigma-70 family RNA polymerase sigma factor [Planctomycetota bacterium]
MNTETAEELLRHQAALRALARTLVADEARADDVVQDAWLAALRRPPAERGNLGGWLAAVARNAARQMGRAEDRRRRREILAALPERLPATAEVAERAAVHRELVGAVLALNEPYRSTLLLRYFEGLPPRVIAERLREKVATVQARLLRGRQRLREELDRRYGDRASWRGYFVLALGGPRAFLGPDAPLGWLHSAPAKTAAAGLLVGGLLVGGGAMEGERFRAGERDEPVAALPPAGAPATPTSEVAPAAAAVPADADGRVAAHTDTGGGAAARSAAAAGPSGPPTAMLDPPPGPPGTVPVRGGRTSVGTSPEELLQARELDGQLGDFLIAETPRHTVAVDDFHLMVTEVTHEQYAAYVAATGARPPHVWGSAEIDRGRSLHLERELLDQRQATAAGKPLVRGEPFDPLAWWGRNWRGKTVEVPADILDHPVTFVSYDEARAYARWAGLRLMTEHEFQRAARRDTNRTWPWGDAWDAGKASSGERGDAGLRPVGSFPAGAVQGLFDLAGNVWEWTSSPFVKYPGYTPLKLSVGEGRALELAAPFDAAMRVAVGGGFSNDRQALRVSTRRATAPSQSTSALGFRCAASVQPGRDLVEEVVAELALSGALPAGAGYRTEQALVLHRWSSEASPQEPPPHLALPRARRPPGYAVITAYDALLFVPAERVNGINERGFKEASRASPSHLGLLHTSLPLREPELDPGTYLVAYRAAGELPALEPRAASPTWAKAPGFDAAVDCFVVFDTSGAAVAAFPSKGVLYDRLKEGSIRWSPATPSAGVAAGEATPAREAPDLVFLHPQVPGGQRRKGFGFRMRLALEPGRIDATWSSD